MEKKALFTFDISLLMLGYAFAVIGNHPASFLAACASLFTAVLCRGYDRLSRVMFRCVIRTAAGVAAAFLCGLPSLLRGVCVCIYCGVCVSELWIGDYKENSSVYHLLMGAMVIFCFAAMFMPSAALPPVPLMVLVVLIFAPFTFPYVLRCFAENELIGVFRTTE
ncbi:MAG: hypothetical protein K6G61_02455 [Solobacterium sp.]|nr:hypothetical protein [Solobacterium sp.]